MKSRLGKSGSKTSATVDKYLGSNKKMAGFLREVYIARGWLRVTDKKKETVEVTKKGRAYIG